LVAPQLFQATSTDIGELLKSLFFIPFEKNNGLVQPTLFVGWTLNYEMFFYSLLGAALIVRDDLSRNLLLIAGLTTLTILGLVLRPNDVIVAFFTAPFLLNFVFGIAIGVLTPYVPTKASKSALAGVLTLSALALIIQFVATIMLPTVHTVVTGGVTSALMVGGLVIAERWGWRITSPTIILLGNATYSIYLTHPFVAATMERLSPYFSLTPASHFFALIFTMALALIVGVLVYRHVELPLSELARKVRFPGYRPARPQSAAAQQSNG
jgi:peptidoglycan/LPS O-acetylase OafA/YrhL